MAQITFIHQCYKKFSPLPLVIGFFDGLHRGHSALFKQVNKNKFNILTFINVPSKNKDFIYSADTRLEDLKTMSPQHIFVLDLKNNNMPMSQFIVFLRKVVNPSCIYVGSNFRFGKNRLGNINELKQDLKTIIINVINKYSTSDIKTLLSKGDLLNANKMLLQPYHLTGKVIKGNQYGRVLGFKTANVYNDEHTLNIKAGIYAGYVFIKNHKYPAAIFVHANNPKGQLFEAHLLNGFNTNIYNKTITIEPTKFIKVQQKTNSFKELQTVICKSVKQVSKILKV
ncbi:MAG: hypothetical protein LBV37_01275 [Mycoplasmataceae bacterium]|jgi:riboflavin kinase/FMN adenylyltransferase|nr:hypothetical protein [Mycoplasmataceae bacterium]